MKLRTRLALLPLVALLALPALAADTPPGIPFGAHPKLVAPKLVHSFGDVKPGTPLEHRFEIRNEGNADLVIQKVKAACGCTTVEFDSLIAPGKSGGITLAVKKTSSYHGEFEKKATVTTNDPEHASFKLTLHAMFPEKK